MQKFFAHGHMEGHVTNKRYTIGPSYSSATARVGNPYFHGISGVFLKVISFYIYDISFSKKHQWKGNKIPY